MLRAEYTSQLERDIKRLKEKHADLDLLKDVVRSREHNKTQNQ